MWLLVSFGTRQTFIVSLERECVCDVLVVGQVCLTVGFMLDMSYNILGALFYRARSYRVLGIFHGIDRSIRARKRGGLLYVHPDVCVIFKL